MQNAGRRNIIVFYRNIRMLSISFSFENIKNDTNSAERDGAQIR